MRLVTWVFAAMFLMLAPVACTDDQRSSISDAAGSISVSPPGLPTDGTSSTSSGADTETRTPTATDTQTRTETETQTRTETETQTTGTESEVPDEQAASPGTEEDAGDSSAWVGPLIGAALLAALVALFFVRRASRRHDSADWRTSASAIVARATSLHDDVAAELADPRADDRALHRWEDLAARADQLTADISVLETTSPDDGARTDAGRLRSTLTELRMSMGSAPPAVVTPRMRDDLAAFDGAVAQLRARSSPTSTAPGQPG